MINLKSKEYLLNAVLEYCEDIVTVKNLSLKYVAYNKAFLNIINARIDTKIIGSTLAEILPKECVEIIESYSKKVISTLESQTYTFMLPSTIGENKIIKQTTTPIIKDGVLEGLLTVSSDVTNEEYLKTKLIAKNYQLYTLLENLPILIYMKDKDRNLIIANSQAKQFVLEGIDVFANGIKIDMQKSDVETTNEDNYVLQNKKTLVKEKSAVDIEGKLHWYSIHKVPILTDNNDIMGLITIAQNIDKEKHLENQKSLFLATLSHDLKNPLQAQISSLQLFNKGMFGQLNDTQKEMLDMILESSIYMKDMLYSLLKSGKDNNGVIVFDRKYFNFDTMVAKCVKEVTDLALSKNITLQVVSELNENDKLYADEMQMRRVVGNMLNNGINYAFENSVLKISLTRVNDSIIFKVANKSAKISDTLKQQIFDKYVCGEPLQSSNGIGLGLYFCKKVVEANEGRISLEANQNDNVFVIELPILSEKNVLISKISL